MPSKVLDTDPLTFHYNFLGLERYTISSPEQLPKGKSTVRFDFAYDGSGMGKGGTGSLSINGKKVAEGRIKRTVAVVFSTEIRSMWVRIGARRCRQPISFRSRLPAN